MRLGRSWGIDVNYDDENIEALSIADLPDDWWKELHTCEILASEFNNHLLPLLIRGSINGERIVENYSGFPISYQGQFFWVTAGHVIKKIDDLLNLDSFECEEMKWLDGFDNPNAASVTIINHDLDKFWIFNEDLDFGLIRIPSNEARLLIKNDALVIMDEQIWKHLELANPIGFYLVGFPQEWSNIEQKLISKTQTKFSFSARIACLPLRKISRSELPITLKNSWNDEKAFYGRILEFEEGEQFQPYSIKGMSGGPILSIELDKNEQFKYRLFGIQSKWGEQSRIICAEPMEKLITMFLRPSQ